MFTVLDVSRWQGGIDWDTVKASGRVHGVMLRALGSRSGTPYIDPMFETNYSACTRLGIPVGVYYYSCAVTAPQRDAELALLHVRKVSLVHYINILDILFWMEFLLSMKIPHASLPQTMSYLSG